MINDKQPLISIIIPCYNYAHFLSECFVNLNNQSYTNWECLVVDNASTDNSKDVIHSFAQSDNRIKYLHQPVKGPSAARNMGIKAAKGSYIQLLDADDLLQVNKFKNGLALFDADANVDIVYTDMRYFANDNKNEMFYAMQLNKIDDKPWMCYTQGRKMEMLPELLNANIMVISSPLIKKSSLDEIGYFDETLDYNEDWELWLRFAFADKKFVVDKADNSMTLIRVHNTSHSSNNVFKMFLAGLRIGYKYEPLIEDITLKTKFKQKTQFAIYSLEKIMYKKRSDVSFLKESLRLLVKVLPDKKYLIWLSLIEKEKNSVLHNSISINYVFSYLKQKIKNG
jgi:glycosyltransferase involved in cell wall biosynthesis